MKVELYKITCLTNMHVGNGDVNFNIIDNEVQRDPVTNLPTINSSGIKGALREYFSELDKEAMEKDDKYGTAFKNVKSFSDKGTDEYKKACEELFKIKKPFEENTVKIFGTKQNECESKPGNLKFLSGNLLALPMRASKGEHAFYMVTTKNAIHQYLEFIQLRDPEKSIEIEGMINPSKSYRIGDSEISVEGKIIDEKIIDEKLETFLKDHIGDNAIIMKDTDMKEISLPVMARNYLENGKSESLWFEEIVPHHSIFYFTVMAQNPDVKLLNLFEKTINKKIIQFGGNASIGYGYTKVEKL